MCSLGIRPIMALRNSCVLISREITYALLERYNYYKKKEQDLKFKNPVTIQPDGGVEQAL
jgi:hypothetical protein